MKRLNLFKDVARNDDSFVLFWILIFLGREELGFKGIIISIVIWISLLLGLVFVAGVSPYYFIALNALLDIVLFIIIFGGDINIPLR
ncbi:MAG: hypothetical protein ACYSTT_15060 [Planctomycetota bacterium]|jgi:hypothetical protein